LLGSVVDRTSYRREAAKNFKSLAAAIEQRDTAAAVASAKNHCDYFTTYLLEIRLAAEEDWK
jgi:DNA-binding GntR family transcriptional regulator